jgi:hypothetical protein
MEAVATLEDLEDLAALVAEYSFHFDLTRTRNRSGVWEARFNPTSFGYEGKWPYGRSHDCAEAIQKAIDELPPRVRDAIAELTNHPQEPT